ncbi:hypothetical protein SAMN06295924_10212 [Rathayibacter rathayi NCPPB 2980 = VKM Ac-1601]|nr:hypothetical protein SAMN06295924_10212 [Rathayibacter rathayi NCPPB 2980 = VKM Ac-1601]
MSASVVSRKTRKHWIRAGAALASVAAVAAGSLVAAGSASAAHRVVEVSPAPYVWSDSDRFGAGTPLPVPGDATTLTVELPDSSVPADPATNSIDISLARTVDSFGGTSPSLNLTGYEDPAADAYAPTGVDRTGFILDLAAFLTVAAPSGSAEADLDLSAPTTSDRTLGGSFWAGGGTVTEAGTGDVIVLDSGVPGFFDLTGLRATVGTEDSADLRAPTQVLNGGASIAVKPPQEFYDRYLTFGDTSPLGAPSVQVSGLSKGVEHHSDSDAHLGRRSDRHASRGHRPPGHGRRGVESDLHPGRPGRLHRDRLELPRRAQRRTGRGQAGRPAAAGRPRLDESGCPRRADPPQAQAECRGRLRPQRRRRARSGPRGLRRETAT